MYETAQAYPGITPYVYLFVLPYSLFVYRGSRLIYCTKYEMVDGSASEALQTHVQYRRHQWLMGALLKRSRPMNGTWRCTPFYVQYRRHSPYCVLYIAHHIGHSSI